LVLPSAKIVHFMYGMGGGLPAFKANVHSSLLYQMIRLVKALTVPRKGKAADVFAPALEPAAVAKLLTARKGHTYAEFLHGDTITKLYFDTERYFDAPPTLEQHDGYKKEVVDAMDTIVGVLRDAASVAWASGA
jgi:hypothetical protein